MTEAHVRLARPGDAELLAPRMRAEDAAECLASCGLGPLPALLESIAASRVVFALELGGELAALFGVVDGPRKTLLGPTAFDIIWSLTSDAVTRHPRAFWRESKRIVAELLRAFPELRNAIDARYTAALRWVARLGAEVQPAEPWGVSGLPFHRFIWRA